MNVIAVIAILIEHDMFSRAGGATWTAPAPAATVPPSERRPTLAPDDARRDRQRRDRLAHTARRLLAVVGVLVNWVAQRWLADKRVKRERQVAKDQATADAAVQARIDEAEMRTAARLIRADLSVAVGHLKAIIRTGEWAEYLRLDLRHWDAEQRTLAKRLK